MQPNDRPMPEHHEAPLGIAGKTTKLFLDNRPLSLLTLSVLALWGGLSFFLMPKQYNPEIVAPAFSIVVDFPGASAEETRELLTRRLEDAVAELPQVDEISSQSFAGGRSALMVKFFVGSDQEDATVTLAQKLRDIRPNLPSGASDPSLQSITPDDVPILDINLSSRALSESSLRKLAVDVADQLKLVPGISKAEVKGGRINHLQVEVDAQAMAAHHLSLSEISGAIAKANGSLSIDSLQNEGKKLSLSVSAALAGVDDLARVVIRKENDTLLRLQDIARISYGPGELREFVRLSEKNKEGAPVVHLALSKLKGENATTVSEETLRHLEELKSRLVPEDVTVSVLRDEGRTADEEISKLTFDLIKSILIVATLLALFLGIRNALVASVSIPLVLLTVFGVGLLAGQTVNRITLFALILSLGLLVDDAIVVVENIARYFRLSPKENKIRLIIRAVDEVGGALALSTLTMALAFVPMAFVTGMMGPYMGPIPFFVPAALIASLLISVSLNPFLAFLFTSRHGQDKDNTQKSEKNFFTRAMARAENWYAQTLSLLLHNRTKRRLTLAGIFIALLLALALPFSPLIPFRMLPKADKEQFYLYLDLPDGTEVRITDAVTRALEKNLLEDSDILNVESFVGTSQVIDFNGLFKGSAGRTAENQATLRTNLSHPKDRDTTSEEIAFRVRDRLDSFKQSYPDAVVRIVEDPPGPPVLSTFLLKIKGGDDKTRENIARDLADKTEALEGIVDLDTSIPERGLDATYRIDTNKAQALGISPEEAASALHTAFSGAVAGIYRETPHPELRKAEQEYIIIRFAKNYRSQEKDLALIRLANRSGESVSLAEVIRKEDGAIEKTLAADNREKVTFISAEMSNRSVIYAVLDLLPKLLAYRLPDGNGHLVKWSPLGATYEDLSTHKRFTVEIDGEWKLTLEVFRDLGLAMGAAIFLIFFVLAARAGSLAVPALIMVSIPLGLIGILPGFAVLHAIKGTYFNATSMIGVIALSGLSVKNAVIYLEYLEPLRRSGMPLREALVEAGRIRLMPIMLTSLAAIFGSLTIVTDPVWEGLAWSIIFGLSASTLLTLIVFPLLYFLFEHKHKTSVDTRNSA